MSYFNQAQNFIINDLNQYDIRIDWEQRKENAFESLQRAVVPGASHNSKERYDAPKCHPDTRRAVLCEIQTWLDSSKESSRILWLHGPAGAGKSAIAQTTAIDCHLERKLTASFFFSRYSDARNKKDGLVATIAYQICISIPAARGYVNESIERNPNIFQLDIKSQLQLLVVEPLSRVYQGNPGRVGRSLGPRLIIIDGLDECEIRKDQAEIIEAFATSLATSDAHGLRLLLASRPELEIRQAFKMDNISSLCTQLVLDNTFTPDKDIDLYLRSHFQVLKRQHEIGPTLPVTWPSEEAINQIVAKSSGQFIYASTVIKYISDPRRTPTKRLDIILKILPEYGDKPYSQLDALYSAILSTCEDYEKVTLIFEVIMFLHTQDESGFGMLQSIDGLESFLELEGELLLLLADLHSIVDVNNIRKTGFRFYHASMYDFLTDASRSYQFYIDIHNAHASMSIRCLEYLVNSRSLGFPNTVSDYSFYAWIKHYENSGWDDRVLNYILQNEILKPNNRHISQALRTFRSHPHAAQSMLGELVTYILLINKDDLKKVNAHDES